MVRFKNRHLLVEFLTPSTHSPSFPSLAEPPQAPTLPHARVESNDEEDELTPIPTIPFLVPQHDPSSSQLKLGDEGGSIIFRAVRACVQEVFGDEGWGRVASSFKVIYHSPLTTLTIIRIARQHYRLIWAGITMLTSINGQAVLPRVIAVSGTIKKLQNRAISYHRLVTGQLLVAAVERAGQAVREEEKRALKAGWAKEVAKIQTLGE